MILDGYKTDDKLDKVLRSTQNLFYRDRFSDILMKEEVKVMERNEGRVRGFEVVSSNEYSKDVILPKRSTENSAGYDFFAYKDILIPPSCFRKDKIEVGRIDKTEIYELKPFIVKTGVKAYMGDDEVLMLYNRSSNPNKLHLVLANGVGVVDSDYYNNPDNEGEIGFLFYNISPNTVVIPRGSKIGQGVFHKYLKADGDKVTEKRVGGHGSTGR